MGKVQTADARFLWRIMMVMVVLTLGTGTMAAYTTVSAVQTQGVDVCQATGFLCAD